MKKYLKKFSVMFIILFTVIAVQHGISTSAAVLGDQLSSPEDGWKRYEHTDSNITYDDSWRDLTSYHLNDKDGVIKVGATVKFDFYGTKLRIMAWMNYDCSGANIKIDGKDYGNYSDYTKSGKDKCLVFEKLGLSKSKHSVVITSIDKEKFKTTASNNYFAFEAIDIDSDGELQAYSNVVGKAVTGISLNKTSDSLMEGETDILKASVIPYDADNKNIKWTTSDSSVATVDENGKVTAVKAGTAEIMAVTEDGSFLSKCIVTVTEAKAEVNLNRAVLTITMSNNAVKKYDLSQEELNAFLNWYDSRTRGIGPAYYVLESRPVDNYISNKDYILYDKIEFFNIQEYK